MPDEMRQLRISLHQLGEQRLHNVRLGSFLGVPLLPKLARVKVMVERPAIVLTCKTYVRIGP
jgi:hypothetical protein